MTEFKIKGMGYWGGNECRADVECDSLEEFLTYPTHLLIDGHMYDKKCYHIQNKCAFYTRPPKIVTMNGVAGTFEVIDVTKDNHTNITVE